MKMNISWVNVISFLIGLLLAIILLKSINYRNCIVLSSNVSNELLGTKMYSEENDKCYRMVKKE